MSPPAPSPAVAAPLSPGLSSAQDERLRYLPPPARDAFLRFQATADLGALDDVILAILCDHLPRTRAQDLASLPGGTRLIEDLGFDSLALTEAVFCLEDLLGLSIANQEIVLVRTLDDLRGFVRRKVAALVKT